jgi:hypothetical protein
MIFVSDYISLELYRIIGPGIEEGQLMDSRLSMPLIEVFPNPFSDKANIKYQVKEVDSRQNSVVSIKIYEATGRMIKSFNHITNSPFNQIIWDGTDNNGTKLPQGVYFIKLQTEDKFDITKVILLK